MSRLFTARLQLYHSSEKWKWTQILRRDVADEVIGDLNFTIWYSSRIATRPNIEILPLGLKIQSYLRQPQFYHTVR